MSIHSDCIQGSNQQQATSRAAATLSILPAVECPIALDQDVAAFKMEQLKSEETDEFISAAVIRKAQDEGSSGLCCEALNSPGNPKLRKRCSQARKSDCNLCHRHWAQQEKGKKQVVLFNE